MGTARLRDHQCRNFSGMDDPTNLEYLIAITSKNRCFLAESAEKIIVTYSTGRGNTGLQPSFLKFSRKDKTIYDREEIENMKYNEKYTQEQRCPELKRLLQHFRKQGIWVAQERV